MSLTPSSSAKVVPYANNPERKRRKGLSSTSLIQPTLPSITLSESSDALIKSPSTTVIVAWGTEIEAPPPIALTEKFTWTEFIKKITIYHIFTALFCAVVSS